MTGREHQTNADGFRESAATKADASRATHTRVHPHPLLLLQQAAGNRAFGSLVQARLRVSEPGDEFEREADRVAAEVVRAPDPAATHSPVAGKVQTPHVQRACTHCEEEEELRRKPAGGVGIETPQPSPHARQGGDTTPATRAGISSLAGGGQPLPESERAFFESRLGQDFSDVRLHTDSASAESARSVEALAYTAGSDVVFGAGQYRPHTDEGRQLLAHELVHVVQQRQGRATRDLQRRTPWQDEEDPLEREAEEGDIFDPSPYRQRGLGGRRNEGGTLPYREAMESIVPPPRPRPPASLAQDTRARVLPAEQVMFNDLRTYIRGLPVRLQALLAAGNAAEPWLTQTNPNVQSALRVLDQLVADLAGPSFVLRFDQPAGTSTAASFDFLNDMMRLQPFAGVEQRTLLASDLLHEYTHLLQDREAERVFARQRAPHEHTRAEDLQKEIGARREQVYFGEMLRVLGEPVPTDALLGSQLSGMIFRGRFETERTATTATARRVATRDIRTSIETPYAAQLATNSSIRTYSIEIASNNHALLHWDLSGVASPRDLGEVPRDIADTNLLHGHLIPAVSNLPEFRRLFVGTGNRQFNIATFAVVYNDMHITEFGLARPTP